MGNLMVAVLGSQGYAGALGKKGTSTDITMYNLKKGEDTVTFVEPSRYPERLAPLFYSISQAKKAIVVVDELNGLLGECLVMLQCCDVNSGYFVLRNYIPKEKLQPLIKGTIFENYAFTTDDPVALQNTLLREAAQQKPAAKNISGTVTVDHAFNVKGVGTVILGEVINGTVQKHDQLKVLPGEKTAQVRSIQKSDDEFNSATEGDRVGLALKNIEIEALDRGTVLTTDATIMTATSFSAQASLVKYWQSHLKEGMVIHVGHWVQFITCKVEGVDEQQDWHKPTVKVSLEKPLVYRAGDTAVLMYLEGGKLRVAGKLQLP